MFRNENELVSQLAFSSEKKTFRGDTQSDRTAPRRCHRRQTNAVSGMRRILHVVPPDAKILAAGGNDAILRLWDLAHAESLSPETSRR